MKLVEKERLLKIIVDRCKKKIGEDLVSIILFGSLARGDFDGRSDIDLLIVMENDRKEDILKDIRLEFLNGITV